MISHKIYARHSGIDIQQRLDITLIKSCIRATLSFENVDMPCEVSVLITDDRSVREINREFRGIDAPTDVLSFPMQEFAPPGWSASLCEDDPETGLVPLGEIVLSAEHVRTQAGELGHSAKRETAYLTVHSVLHLLGYDHIDEAEDKKKMREHEEAIMQELGCMVQYSY